MMDSVVELSRIQFAFTAIVHFLFVPLTLGLSWMLLIMESVYVMTGKQVYKDMTQFWGKLFAINFAMGVVTGLTMEFQFGQNWAYYSYYVGDIFGIPLAIEGSVAFMLESTFLGLFFFGWNKLSKQQHLASTLMLAIGSNLSALFILVANAWMQYPTGAEFNYATMRMELLSFSDVFFNPVAQVKFVHTLSAGYVTAATFVLGISSFYLLKGRDIGFAKRSFAIAAGFGLASVLSVIVLGDESGYEIGDVQQTKLAAIEAEWETQPAPAGFTIFGIPNQAEMRTDYEIKVPWVLGLIATRSIDEKVVGLKDLMTEHEAKIRKGMLAYGLLDELRNTKTPSADKIKAFDDVKKDLGYGLLLKRYTDKVVDATEADIKNATKDTIPNVFVTFWSFRLMVGAGFILLLLYVLAIYGGMKKTVWTNKAFLWFAVCCIPLPWIAAELGWIVAEMGRQPWTIGGVLPTFLSVSSITGRDVFLSLSGFVILYSVLVAIEVFLMMKYVKLGPSSLGTGRYFHERFSINNIKSRSE